MNSARRKCSDAGRRSCSDVRQSDHQDNEPFLEEEAHVPLPRGALRPRGHRAGDAEEAQAPREEEEGQEGHRVRAEAGEESGAAGWIERGEFLMWNVYGGGGGSFEVLGSVGFVSV